VEVEDASLFWKSLSWPLAFPRSSLYTFAITGRKFFCPVAVSEVNTSQPANCTVNVFEREKMKGASSMADSVVTPGQHPVIAAHQERPVSTLRFDLVMGLLSIVYVSGVYLDGWAHAHGLVDRTFFTPWHAVLYSGYLVNAIVLQVKEGHMAAEERQETREEEIARIRSYFASQSMKRTPAQLIEAVREAHRQFLAAAAAIPAEAFSTPPQAGEWSAADVLNHVYRIAALEEQSIRAVVERGEQPADVLDLSASAAGLTPEQMLADISAMRERLAASALQADPQAHLDITWRGSDFGMLNWREWLLFARIHELDHARQLQAIAAALSGQEGK